MTKQIPLTQGQVALVDDNAIAARNAAVQKFHGEYSYKNDTRKE